MLFRSLFGFYLKFFQKITKQVSKNTQNKGDPLSLIRFLDSSKDKKTDVLRKVPMTVMNIF